MEKTYTMQDVAAMTGLTTRTLRSYQQQGFLRGEKENGVWRFTDEALEGFFQNPAVLPAIRARQHSIVYDFVLQNRKPRDELCAVWDLRTEDSEAVSAFLCREMERRQGLRFTFLRRGENARVILCGEPGAALDLLNALRSVRTTAGDVYGPAGTQLPRTGRGGR